MRNRFSHEHEKRGKPVQETSGKPGLEILYEDNHLLVLNKPAMLPTQGGLPSQKSLLVLAKAYLKAKYSKPGNVYLGTVNRLDAPVTGVVLFARTSKAARRLTEQFRERRAEKGYRALIPTGISPARDTCVDWLRKDERHRKVHICRPDHPDGQEARLSFRVISTRGTLQALQIALETGRKHQIRVQLAHRGYPIVGDRKYGSTRKFEHGIALHARQLTVDHPVQRSPMTFVAPLPMTWSRLGFAN